MIAQCRPTCPIIAITRSAFAAPQMHLSYGVFPLVYTGAPLPCVLLAFAANDRGAFAAERAADWPTDVDNRINYGITVCKDRGFVRSGDLLIVVTGWRQGESIITVCLSLVKFIATLALVQVLASRIPSASSWHRERKHYHTTTANDKLQRYGHKVLQIYAPYCAFHTILLVP